MRTAPTVTLFTGVSEEIEVPRGAMLSLLGAASSVLLLGHSQQGWVSLTCLCPEPAQPQHHREPRAPALTVHLHLLGAGQPVLTHPPVCEGPQPLPGETAAEWGVNCAGSEYKTSEFSVLGDSCTQWHHRESQHEGTESCSDLPGQRDASVSMFGDMHFYCTLSLPLTETSFFAEWNAIPIISDLFCDCD